MAQYEEEFEEFENDTPLVKKLRKQIDALQKQVTERDEKIADFSTMSRKKTIESILEEFGLTSRIAKYIPTDVEADEDAIYDWLIDNGEDFGIELVDDGSPTDESQHAAELMEAVETGGIDPSLGQDLASRIASAKTQEELMAILNG